jgi:large subunit ribosomal protein L15
MRGSKHNGHGAKCKARGGGSRGGRGMTGGLAHKRFKFMKEFPDHFGKCGFNSLRMKGIKKGIRAITLRDLDAVIRKEKITGQIDVSKLGYDKVIGSGALSCSITVKADYFSAGAEEKIAAAGGRAVKTAAEEPVETYKESAAASHAAKAPMAGQKAA